MRTKKKTVEQKKNRNSQKSAKSVRLIWLRTTQNSNKETSDLTYKLKYEADVQHRHARFIVNITEFYQFNKACRFGHAVLNSAYEKLITRSFCTTTVLARLQRRKVFLKPIHLLTYLLTYLVIVDYLIGSSDICNTMKTGVRKVRQTENEKVQKLSCA